VNNHPNVLGTPTPTVTFEQFGESTLNLAEDRIFPLTVGGECTSL